MWVQNQILGAAYRQEKLEHPGTLNGRTGDHAASDRLNGYGRTVRTEPPNELALHQFLGRLPETEAPSN